MSMWGTRLSEFDQIFGLMDNFRRRMDRLMDDVDVGRSRYVVPGRYTWPRTNLYDTDSELVLEAVVPGLSEQDVHLTATQNAITISGERKPDAPEKYSVHRQERAPVRFSRSFRLPCKIDVEKVGATMKNGVLTVNMAKSAEAQPRQITVKAGK